MKKLLLFVSLCTYAGCSHINAISQTNLPSYRAKKISAAFKKILILGINTDNNGLAVLTQKLREQCPKGYVRGITTTHWNTLYFLFFVTAQEVEAQAYCLSPEEAKLDSEGSLK